MMIGRLGALLQSTRTGYPVAGRLRFSRAIRVSLSGPPNARAFYTHQARHPSQACRTRAVSLIKGTFSSVSSVTPIPRYAAACSRDRTPRHEQSNTVGMAILGYSLVRINKRSRSSSEKRSNPHSRRATMEYLRSWIATICFLLRPFDAFLR